MHRAAGIVAVILSAVFVTGILTLAVERFIFVPYLRAMDRTTTVRIQPTAWQLEARCPSCGHTWSVSADTYRNAVLAEVRP